MTHLMSPPYEEDNYNLDDEDEKALIDENLVTSQIAGGKRTISAAFLNPSSSDISSSGSLSSSASIRYHPSSSTKGTFALPTHLDSVAAIEHCGFTTQAAQEMFTRYHRRPDKENNPDSIFDYMRSQVLSADLYNQLSPSEALRRVGLGQETRDAIMDPNFYEVRMTETVTYWALNTISVNWKTLIRLMENLKAAATRSRARKKYKKQHVGNVFPPQADQPAAAPAPAYSATVQSTLVEGLSRQRTLPSAYVATVTTSPPEMPNHYILYKAKAAVEMDDWLSEEDGTILMEGLQTLPGGDFNWKYTAHYWTLERAAAEQYHAWAQTRCPWSEIWMIQVQLPVAFISGLSVKDLWFSPDWKQFIWHCRKKREPPAKYDDFWKRGKADLIRGHISKSTSHLITNIAKQDVQDRMGENNVMHNPDGRKASQWCFVQEDSIARFGREIKGKIHVEITPPLHNQGEEGSTSAS